ncbi:MAG: hypothetical protein HZC41_22795 [Chloroflexi bacterium]|nr:hypothetical protein [Chloroflexota bacterium]
MSQQQNNQPPNRPQNPFSRPFGTASANSARPSSGQPPATPGSSPPSGSRLGGLPRFGGTKANWRIVPLAGVVVRFDLDGLGDPFYHLLGKPLHTDYADQEVLIQAIEAGGPDVNELESVLDRAWQTYELHGAVLLYPWRTDLPQVMVGQMVQGDEDDEDYEDEKPPAPTFLRSLDLRLVLNVLARTRANILLSRAPLGLEKQYLAQSLFTDDPRLVTLARATGCIEEALVK